MKKIISILLSAVLFFGVVAAPVSACADSFGGLIANSRPQQFVPASIGEEIYEAADLPVARVPGADHPVGYTHYISSSTYNSLKKLMEQAYKSHNTNSISLRSYNIKYRDWQKYEVNTYSIFEDILGSNPEYFDLADYTLYTTNDGYLHSIKIKYALSLTEYNKQLKACELAADYLIGDLINADIYPFAKALLAHDRLVLWNEYDHAIADNDDRRSYWSCQTMYGALVLQKSVCEGYTKAYGYLLDKLGIQNYECITDCGAHIWNIVRLGGEYYHVDTTWDDVDGANGEVSHEYFLCSNYDFGHGEYTFDRTPTDTYYDDFWWQYSDSEFQLINDRMWFVINNDKSGTSWKKGLICYYDFDENVIYSKYDVSDSKWYTTSGSYYVANQTRLDTDGTYLYYSLPQNIVRVNVKDYSRTTVKTTTGANYYNIWGFKIEGGNMYCSIYKDASYQYTNKSAYSTSSTGTYLVWKNGSLQYIKNGVTNTTATTLVKHGNTWYYVKNGKVDAAARTLVKYNGVWYFVENGKVDFSATTLVNYNNQWWYVKAGKMNTSNTLVNYKGVYYHVNGGKWVKDTTLVKYKGVWYYVKGGKLDKSDTLVLYSGTWYHVKGGKLANDTTLVKYNNQWWYVKAGKMARDNTLVKYNGKYYHVNGGKWVKDTTIVAYGGSKYYVKGGVMQSNYSGTVKISNKYYKIKNGKVV